MKNKVNNPFPTVKYLGPEYFCDREKETKFLLDNIKGGISTTLISLRRIGKTALIKHIQNSLTKEWESVYIDILATENLNQFINNFTNAIVQNIPEKSKLGKKIWNQLKALRVEFSYDQNSGIPSLSLNLNERESKTHIENIFKILENHNKNVLISIDEFQQITKYPEKNIDAFLRTIIQKLQNVVFIFSGSQQNLMMELFNDPSRAFYKSTSFLHLKPIDRNVYKNFIIKMFSDNNKKIDDNIVENILDWTKVHTYYVQLLCNRVYTNTKSHTPENLWEEEADKLIKEQELMFFNYREMLGKTQWKLIKAIAKQGNVFSLTSTEFIKKYDLGSSSAVLRAVKSLIQKDLIVKQFNDKGNSFYSVYDIILFHWLNHLR